MRTLIVLRHAKSSWDTGAADHERPLNNRGMRQGYAAGEYLLENHCPIDRVLCSTSTRTRQTLERVMEVGIDPAEVTFHSEIYEADVADILPVLRSVPDDNDCVLFIGHFPGVEDLVEYLDTSLESRQAAVLLIEEGFVTSGIAVLTIDTSWAELREGSGKLIDFVPAGR